jgi:molybdate transport system substrate-binding protein
MQVRHWSIVRRAAATACVLLTLAFVSRAQQPLAVAAASDLQVILPTVASAFERTTGQKVNISFGSSGNFLAQIKNGAPFDMFLSADIEYPRELDREGLAEPGTLLPYATGSLVLWTRTGSGLDVRRGLEGLLSDRVRHIAIANPEHAPYGRAAVAALRAAGLYEKVRGKLVLGENVSQAGQFVQSGNADAGLVPLSFARAPAASAIGQYVAVPSSLYPPIEQAAVLVRASRNKDAARAFLAFLNQPATRTLFADAGFGPAPSGR